jgi:hypothetical protein
MPSRDRLDLRRWRERGARASRVLSIRLLDLCPLAGCGVGGYYDLETSRSKLVPGSAREDAPPSGWDRVYDHRIDAIVFQTELVPYAPRDGWPADPVIRAVAVREDQTLEQLHEALRLAFGWPEPHLYAFWVSERWWDGDASQYRSPHAFEGEVADMWTARTSISDIHPKLGMALTYVFDFGDEWRLAIKITDSWPAEGGVYPQLVEASGTPPTQYPEAVTTIQTARVLCAGDMQSPVP